MKISSAVDFELHIRKNIESSIAVKQALLASATLISDISSVTRLLITALKSKKKVLLFGNGGSAADAQHIAAELVGRFGFDRPALPALALTVDTSCITAIANDLGFDQIFARQVEALSQPGDVVIGISTSGNSPNVFAGLQCARKLGLSTVAFTGESGGKLRAIADHCICIPSKDTPRIQECHNLLGHILSEIVEQELFNEKSRLPGS
ncbi:MAG TPA: D-sedoheptulose 7-phosphate isomerase [Candidatus Acidoferrum sp.]